MHPSQTIPETPSVTVIIRGPRRHDAAASVRDTSRERLVTCIAGYFT